MASLDKPQPESSNMKPEGMPLLRFCAHFFYGFYLWFTINQHVSADPAGREADSYGVVILAPLRATFVPDHELAQRQAAFQPVFDCKPLFWGHYLLEEKIWNLFMKWRWGYTSRAREFLSFSVNVI